MVTLPMTQTTSFSTFCITFRVLVMGGGRDFKFGT